jgi:hypothetical protein
MRSEPRSALQRRSLFYGHPSLERAPQRKKAAKSAAPPFHKRTYANDAGPSLRARLVSTVVAIGRIGAPSAPALHLFLVFAVRLPLAFDLAVPVVVFRLGARLGARLTRARGVVTAPRSRLVPVAILPADPELVEGHPAQQGDRDDGDKDFNGGHARTPQLGATCEDAGTLPGSRHRLMRRPKKPGRAKHGPKFTEGVRPPRGGCYSLACRDGSC